MKNPKGSDRAIAQSSGVSQPTVTRMRQKFQKQGIIESYQIIPNLAKLGFEITAFTLISAGDIEGENVIQAIQNDLGTMVISIHKNFTDYTEFRKKNKWIVSMFYLFTNYKPAIKPLSFANIPL